MMAGADVACAPIDPVMCSWVYVVETPVMHQRVRKPFLFVYKPRSIC